MLKSADNKQLLPENKTVNDFVLRCEIKTRVSWGNHFFCCWVVSVSSPIRVGNKTELWKSKSSLVAVWWVARGAEFGRAWNKIWSTQTRLLVRMSWHLYFLQRHCETSLIVPLMSLYGTLEVGECFISFSSRSGWRDGTCCWYHRDRHSYRFTWWVVFLKRQMSHRNNFK